MTIEEHTCDTCEYGEWYRRGYDITMMDDECGGCCSWNDKWKPSEVEEKMGTQIKEYEDVEEINKCPYHQVSAIFCNFCPNFCKRMEVEDESD